MEHIDALIMEAIREVEMRQRNYPKWVRDGRMHPVAADRQLKLMQEIVDKLEEVKSEELRRADERGANSI